MTAVFVDFPENKCNFLHKNKPDVARRPIAGFMTHDTCRLTAKNRRDQLRNPTLGNRAWATFTFYPSAIERRLVAYRHTQTDMDTLS